MFQALFNALKPFIVSLIQAEIATLKTEIIAEVATLIQQQQSGK